MKSHSEEAQIIYLEPEETITDVRQRLERTQAFQITFVIPPHTRLRGYVAWKLLARRAQELDKIVSIVSPLQQVRALARSVHLKVADSLEASSEQRRTNRPVRRASDRAS